MDIKSCLLKGNFFLSAKLLKMSKDLQPVFVKKLLQLLVIIFFNYIHTFLFDKLYIYIHQTKKELNIFNQNYI